MIIVLSKASVASEWCRKELNAGLIRELEERRIVVLPLLLEDCSIPIFLREKRYADFRTDFDRGLRDTLTAIAAVTSNTQGRMEQPDFHTDFGISWGTYGPLYGLQLRFIDHSEKLPFSVLTEVEIICNETLTREFHKFEAQGLAHLGRLKIIAALNEFVKRDLHNRFVLENSLPKTKTLQFSDPKTGFAFEAQISSMRLGQDTGMNTIGRDILK